MFGYVVANLDKLNEAQKTYYRACYCGLCRQLGSQYNLASRLTLTYDMTFLIVLLSSLTGEQVHMQSMRCGIHPTKKMPFFISEYTPYAAAMNLLLAYAQRQDDWKDEHKLLALSQTKLLRLSAAKAEQAYPGQAAAIESALLDLSRMEKDGEPNPDLPAAAFGSLLGEVFVPQEDMLSADALRAFGHVLGRFIYLMDAAIDLKDDLINERYNPLVSVPSAQHETLLQLLMSQCTQMFEKLPIRQNRELLENILYSGVWTKYSAKTRKEAPRT